MKFVKLHLSGALVVDFVLRVTKEARLSFIDVFLYLFFMITESNANQKRYTLLFYKNMYNFAEAQFLIFRPFQAQIVLNFFLIFEELK